MTTTGPGYADCVIPDTIAEAFRAWLLVDQPSELHGMWPYLETVDSVGWSLRIGARIVAQATSAGTPDAGLLAAFAVNLLPEQQPETRTISLALIAVCSGTAGPPDKQTCAELTDDNTTHLDASADTLQTLLQAASTYTGQRGEIILANCLPGQSPGTESVT